MIHRICYFDNLSDIPHNPAKHWIQTFKSMGETIYFDLSAMKRRFWKWWAVKKTLETFNPTHIHFGGTAKNSKKLPPSFVQWARKKFPNAGITFYYEDGYNVSDYFDQVDAFADRIYMNNTSLLKNDRYSFLLSPVPNLFYRQWNEKKEHDIVFIGNNYNSDRLKAVSDLRKKFGMKVFGDGWPKEFKAVTVNYGNEYADLCSSSWIVMADPAGPLCVNSDGDRCLQKHKSGTYAKGICRNRTCDRFSEINTYLSNRTASTLLAGTVHLVPYVKGLSDYFENGHDIAWYSSDEERDGMIRKLLDRPDLCREIALCGQKKAMNCFTIEKAASRIISLDDRSGLF